MSTNNEALRSSFEAWAASYWAQGLDTEWMPEYDAYVDETLQSSWSAYRAASKAALNSLCVGVDSTEEGATISLMSRVGEHITVLACGHTKVGTGDCFMVEI